MAILSVLLATLGGIISVPAFDTTSVSFTDVRSAVLSRNNLLLAERYEAKALYSDSKQLSLYDNPQLNVELPVYAGGRNMWFDYGENGQYYISLQQNFPLSGARNAMRNAGELRAQSVEDDVQQHERELVFNALQSYVVLLYGQQSFVSLSNQLVLLKSLIDGINEQLARGNVSLRDALRIKATYYAINALRTDVKNVMHTARSMLQIATGMTGYLVAGDAGTDTTGLSALITADIEVLVERSISKRADVQSALLALHAAEAESMAEHRKAIPNPSLGVIYDKQGNYARDYLALSLTVPLPTTDRKQYSTEAADVRIQEYQARLEHIRSTARAEVIAAIDRLRTVSNELSEVESNYIQQSEELTQGIIENYRRGNVSLLEFVDFIETYNVSLVRINALKAQRAISISNVHLVLGDDPNEI